MRLIDADLLNHQIKETMENDPSYEKIRKLIDDCPTLTKDGKKLRMEKDQSVYKIRTSFNKDGRFRTNTIYDYYHLSNHIKNGRKLYIEERPCRLSDMRIIGKWVFETREEAEEFLNNAIRLNIYG